LERYLRLFKDVMTGPGDMGATLKSIQELQDFVSVAFSAKAVGQIFLYLLHHGAASAWTLQCDLTIPEASVYRSLKRLRSAGLLVPALKASRRTGTRGGPRPIIWSTEITEVEEIAAALRRHYRLLSPKFRVAEQVALTFINEPEVKYTEITSAVRALKIPFGLGDVSDLAAAYLHESGIKVWR